MPLSSHSIFWMHEKAQAAQRSLGMYSSKSAKLCACSLQTTIYFIWSAGTSANNGTCEWRTADHRTALADFLHCVCLIEDVQHG